MPKTQGRNSMDLQSVLQIPEKENKNYTFALAAGKIIAAKYIRKNRRDEERKKKIDQVLRIKNDALKELAKESFNEPLEKVRLDAHRDDGKRCVVHSDEKLSAFLELEAAIRDKASRLHRPC